MPDEIPPTKSAKRRPTPKPAPDTTQPVEGQTDAPEASPAKKDNTSAQQQPTLGGGAAAVAHEVFRYFKEVAGGFVLLGLLVFRNTVQARA